MILSDCGQSVKKAEKTRKNQQDACNARASCDTLIALVTKSHENLSIV